MSIPSSINGDFNPTSNIDFSNTPKRRCTSTDTYGTAPACAAGGTQEEFELDLLRLIATLRLPYAIVQSPEMEVFVAKWIPGARLPDRHKLSGPLLEKEALAVVLRRKVDLQGKLATYVYDGWKDGKKRNIGSSSLLVKRKVCILGF